MKYKDVKKDVFVEEYEQSDMVKDQKQFLKTMKKLEPYLIEFQKNNTMKAKNYFSDCKVRGDKPQPIIIITNDEYIFSSDDGICKA